MFLRYALIITLLPVCFGKHSHHHHHHHHPHQHPQVNTRLGVIQGFIRTSGGGRNFSAFEGIPYAKPPTGDRRFEEPEPVEPWNGIYNATLRVACLQDLDLNIVSNIDEDCLHINVYVPREHPNSEERLDVIVHIHGGSFVFGSGYVFSDPIYLMDHDVIFVSFNYRLGAFGFMSTEDDVVPGNNGLKDQALALKWIQENIACFGGNPDSVTLTGLSSGGSSVHLHYFSQMSRGLFHRGFSESGVALNMFSLQKGAREKAIKLADAVGCPVNSSTALVKCLKQKPYQEILDQKRIFYAYRNSPDTVFVPVIEKRSRKPFLSEHPYKMLTEGKVYDVPWIVSNTAHEGFSILEYLKDDLDRVNREWEELAPYLLEYNYTLPRSQWKEVARKIKDFYLGKNQNIDLKGNYLKSINLFSDRAFLYDAETAVRKQATVTSSPVYYYYFNYPGDNNETKYVTHGGDLKYFFSDVLERKPLTPNELKMKDVMVDMLVAFAKTNKPTIKGADWKPTKQDELTYLNITSLDDIKLQKTKELTPRTFWKSLGLQENENLIHTNK